MVCPIFTYKDVKCTYLLEAIDHHQIFRFHKLPNICKFHRILMNDGLNEMFNEVANHHEIEFLVFSNLQTPRNKKFKLKKYTLNEKLEAHFSFVR